MAPTRADKEARDPAPAEETILVAQDQLPQAQAEDLAKKEEAGDNKMTSDPQPGSDPTHRPGLLEQLTVSGPQEAEEDQDSMLDPLLDLHQHLHPQDLLVPTADQLGTDSLTTTTLEEATLMVKLQSIDHQKQDQATTGPLDLEAILITDPLDLEAILITDPLDLEETMDQMDLEEQQTIDLMDLEETPSTDLMNLEATQTTDHLDLEEASTTDPLDLEAIPTTDPLDLEEIPTTDPLNLEAIPTKDPLDLEEIPTTGPLDLEEIPTTDPLDLEEIPTIDHLDLEEISMKDQEIQTDQLMLADLLDLQIDLQG